jgi:hypothetical protein
MPEPNARRLQKQLSISLGVVADRRLVKLRDDAKRRRETLARITMFHVRQLGASSDARRHCPI